MKILSIIFLINSILCFIGAWGIHYMAIKKVKSDLDMTWFHPYMLNKWKCAIPVISGFVLAVIPETLLFDIWLDIFWLWIFLANIIVTFVFGGLFARITLKRFASGKGPGVDVFVSILIGIVTLILGVIFRVL